MRTHWLWLLAAGGCTAAPDDAGILSPVNLAALNADIDGHELDVEWIDQPVVPGLDGAWQARTGGLRTYLLPDRLVTMDRRSGGDGWTVSLATARWGRGDALEPVGGGTVWTDGPAFESRRPGWTEWTESTAVGLEHGYTLYDRPAGAGPVVIELDTDAERVVPTRDADGVALWVGGGPVVGWRDLVAYDAAGQRLDASVGAVGTTIRVEVDDGGAVWPLTIDPLVTNEVAQGTPVLGGPNPSRFATSIDLDGSQMIVGDPGIPGPGTVGAAWVMVTNGATVVPWTAASELVPDGQANDVGRAVAVEGQYAAVAVDGTIQFFRHESTGGAEWSYDGEVTISLGTGQVQAMAFADGRLLAGVPSSGADGGAVVSVTRFGSLASPWSIPQQALGTIPNAQLGSAIAADGSRFVAGAPGNNKVKVYRLGTGLVSDFSEVATLSDPDGGGAHRFGSAVAIAGDVVAVGAPGGNHVTVFERTTGDTFGAGTEIEAPWAGIQGFGAGVALDGGLLVVTDHRTDTEPSSVYIYEWVTGSSWGLRESHPIGESIEAPPPVRLNENWVVVGVPGSAAYRVWRREGDALVDQLDSSTALSRYGAAVSVSGRFAAVGAPFDDSAGPDGGKVFVYERTDSEFWLRRNTVSILQSESAHLGQAVDIESEFLAVGAPFDDLSTAPGVGTMRGSVRVFQFDGTSFVLQTTLDSSDFGVSATSDQFGSAVAIDATGVVVGFPGLDVAQGNTNQGGAAVYANADGAITPLTLIEGANNGDQMGRVVGIDAGRIFVGSDLADAAAGRLEVWEFPPEGALPVQSVVLSGAAGDRLGRSMSIEGNLLAVGATGANLGAGKVIVYAVDGNAGYIEQDRFGPMGANGFGEAVAFAGSRLYVGSQAGIKAWRYELVLDSANALWSQEAEILGPAGASSFGKAIAADDDVVLIGDELNDATHFYRLDGEGPPVARPDSYVYPEGSVHSVDAASGLLANDTDPDGDTLTVTGEDAPAYVTIHPDGSLDIDPPADYFGRDVITYEVTANGDAVESTVIVQITNVNDAPTATAPLAPFVVAYGGGLHVQPASDGLLAPGLADDVDNDLLHVELQTGPAHGTFTLNDDGSFEYTPQDGFPGLWTFTYEVCDQSLCTSTLTASIDVHNDPPVGVPEIAWAAFAEDSQFALGAPGLLSEQYVTDTEHDPLTAEVAELPDHGTLLLESSGQVLYTPNPEYAGPDAFSYVVRDPFGVSDPIVVTLSILQQNDPPVAGDDGPFTTDEDTQLRIAKAVLLDNDHDLESDDLTIALDLTPPAHGQLLVDPNDDRLLLYIPDDGYNGLDEAYYVARDDAAPPAVSERATIHLTINPVNDPPVPALDLYEDVTGPLTANVLTNDTDPEGDPIFAQLVAPPSLGQVDLGANGAFTYTPQAGASGRDGFVYVAVDSFGAVSVPQRVDVFVATTATGTTTTAGPTTDEPTACDPVTVYVDGDGDGFGSIKRAYTGCEPPVGYISQAGDCDDTSPDRYPTAVEIPSDGVDQDCDGFDNEARPTAACDTTGSGGVGAWVVVALAALARRRTR